MSKDLTRLGLICTAVFVLGMVLACLSTCMGCGSFLSITNNDDEEGGAKMTIKIQNNTDRDFAAKISAGIGSKSVVVPAHDTRSYWWYRKLLPNDLTFTVSGETK